MTRVRFAPSPTGGLHLGGVRTVLFNYLFARRHQGTFILRIEDTDQARYVPGAEDYIFRCLKWCGLLPDESPHIGGPCAPYRQSERRALYAQYALQLVRSGHAYYAFDTPDELDAMRQRLKTDENPSPQYGHATRMQMRNALSLSQEQVESLLDDGVPYVVRLKMPEGETVTLHDMIRGEVTFDAGQSDDKVLLKADGMPTYHLAVVVDDCLMGITHAFRGEEWLPSAPAHLLLWRYLGWQERMPQWAHLPLILKPDGHGKLSKRDGDRLGFPVFAMDWTNAEGETSQGFRERGFLPEAFINMLAMLGWNDGTGQEIFSIEELIERFDMGRVHKGGAKFDYEKAKWFNNQHIQLKRPDELAALVVPYIPEGINAPEAKVEAVAALIKDRITLLPDFWEHGHYFFVRPTQTDYSAFADKWSEAKATFFRAWLAANKEHWHDAAALDQSFTALATEAGIKKGELMLPLRIMLVGGKHGPGVHDIAAILGHDESAARVEAALAALGG